MDQRIERALKKAAESTDEPLWEKYVILRDRLMANEYTRWAAGFPEGNDHGPGHIERVLEKLGQLVGPDPVNKGFIGGYELYLAVMAVLYHDIGIMRRRSDHASVSAVIVGDEHNDYLINKYDREIIRQAVVSHSSDRDISVETRHVSPEIVIGAHRVRPALIAALVRLADELDEDYRRADPVLQDRADIPESSHFYWEFCRRIWGIRPYRPKHEIKIDISFHNDDLGKIILLGGRKRLFVAAFAEKIAKMNSERRRVNAFLSESLQYDRIRTTLHIDSGSEVEWGRKEFIWSDGTEWQDFRTAFPALLTTPIDKAINRSLDQMRESKFGPARRNLADLAEMIPDLPQIQQLRILYDQACLESLAAQSARTEDVDKYLTMALNYLTDWVTRGKAGGWENAGQNSNNEVARMARDGDLSMVLHHRWSAVERLVGEFRNALPNKQPEVYLGRNGSIPETAMVETPEGQRPVTQLQEGEDIVSMDVRSGQMLIPVAIGTSADAAEPVPSPAPRSTPLQLVVTPEQRGDQLRLKVVNQGEDGQFSAKVISIVDNKGNKSVVPKHWPIPWADHAVTPTRITSLGKDYLDFAEYNWANIDLTLNGILLHALRRERAASASRTVGEYDMQFSTLPDPIGVNFATKGVTTIRLLFTVTIRISREDPPGQADWTFAIGVDNRKAVCDSVATPVLQGRRLLSVWRQPQQVNTPVTLASPTVIPAWHAGLDREHSHERAIDQRQR
jgi:hypothetical protein